MAATVLSVIFRSRRKTVPSRSKAPSSKGRPFFVSPCSVLKDEPSQKKRGAGVIRPLASATQKQVNQSTSVYFRASVRRSSPGYENPLFMRVLGYTVLDGTTR